MNEIEFDRYIKLLDEKDRLKIELGVIKQTIRFIRDDIQSFIDRYPNNDELSMSQLRAVLSYIDVVKEYL